MENWEQDIMTLGLGPIIEYNMDEQQARAYKVCVTWDHLVREMFPHYKPSTISKRGDPRKCSLFRYAWKMLRDTKGYGLADKDVGLYVRAQLEMIRAIKIDDKGLHARIDPVILTGDKAWIRWKIWKKKYDAANEDKQHKEAVSKTPVYRIAQELDATRQFLLRTFDGIPDQDQIVAAMKDGRLYTWVMQRRVTPYYILLSPYCHAGLAGTNLRSRFPDLDFGVFKVDIDHEAIDEFMQRFPEQFR